MQFDDVSFFGTSRTPVLETRQKYGCWECIFLSSSEGKDYHEFEDLTSDMESKNGDVLCFSKLIGWVVVKCFQRGQSALSDRIGFPSSWCKLPALVYKLQDMSSPLARNTKILAGKCIWRGTRIAQFMPLLFNIYIVHYHCQQCTYIRNSSPVWGMVLWMWIASISLTFAGDGGELSTLCPDRFTWKRVHWPLRGEAGPRAILDAVVKR